jgi:hypothetical protein
MTMLATFLCALNLGLALTLFAAERADENLKRAEENRWNGGDDDDGPAGIL